MRRPIHTSLLRFKKEPFTLRNGKVVIEYVGRNIDAAVAFKTSYELGFRKKPDSVRYRVTAELATVDKADYMACNPLFNYFLSLRGEKNKEAVQRIRELSRRFAFGRSLTLRNRALDGKSTWHAFQPAVESSKAAGATISYSFSKVSSRQGVPFVTATIEVTVDGTGFRKETAAPPEHLTVATRFWPAKDREVIALARKITAGKTTNDAKATAILKWLGPGRNLKYAGRTGSRWGVSKFLEQKFGHCWDFSDAFVTLARAAGVPSRQVAGWLYGSSGHVWAEYYREGKGWQQVDPTGGGRLRCGIYHIPYFTTEDGRMPILYLSMPKIGIVPSKGNRPQRTKDRRPRAN